MRSSSSERHLKRAAKSNFHEGLRAVGDEEFGTAVEFLRRALEIDPTFAEANYHLGLINERQGDITAAQRYFEMTLAVDATHAEAQRHLAVLRADFHAVKISAGPMNETAFMKSLRADENSDSSDLLEAMETADFDLTHKPRSPQLFDRLIDWVARFSIMCLPALLSGVVAGCALQVLGLGSLLFSGSIVACITIMLQIIHRRM